VVGGAVSSLHDTDRSAWWLLLLLIPVIGWLVILIFNCQNGTPGNNRFGPDPKPLSLTMRPPAKERILFYLAGKQLRISRRHHDFASPMLSRRQAIIMSISLVYSGLTTRRRPSAISFSTSG
jgi:hypothetical protein